MNGVGLTLAYALPRGLASLLSIAFGHDRRRDVPPRVLGLAFAALLLGGTLALAHAGALRPIEVAIGPPGGSAVFPPLPPKAASAAALAVLALVVAGLWATPAAVRCGAVLLAGAIALLIVLDDEAAALPVLWSGLLIVEAASRLTASGARPSARSTEPVLGLIVVGAPVLWLASQSTGHPAVSSAGVILVGAATAGLPPLGSRLGRGAGAIADGLLPVVGYVLVARGLLADSSALGTGLVAVLGILAIALTLGDARRPGSAEKGPVALGRVLGAAGFLVLAVGLTRGETAAVAGLSALVAGGIVAVLGAQPEDAPAEAPLADATEPAAEDRGVPDRFGYPGRAVAERLAAMLGDLENRYALALGLVVVLIAAFISAT